MLTKEIIKKLDEADIGLRGHIKSDHFALRCADEQKFTQARTLIQAAISKLIPISY